MPSLADQLQRQNNADILTYKACPNSYSAPNDRQCLRASEFTVNRKVGRCLPILSPWGVVHMESIALHRVKSTTSPKYEVPPDRLGRDINNRCVTYEHLKRESEQWPATQKFFLTKKKVDRSQTLLLRISWPSRLSRPWIEELYSNREPYYNLKDVSDLINSRENKMFH